MRQILKTVAVFGLSTSAAFAQSAPQMIELMCDRTFHSHTPSIGTQVEFMHPEGSAYLWYPEADHTIVGEWEVRPITHDSSEICYRYPVEQAGPYFSGYTGDWICWDPGRWMSEFPKDSIRDGDHYGLTSGTVPFVTTRGSFVPQEDLNDFGTEQARSATCGAFMS